MSRTLHSSAARRAAALILSLSFVIPLARTQAQTNRGVWYRQVSRQLDDNTAVMAIFGERRSHNDFIDRLYQDRAQDVELTLRAGERYVFAGVCDEDCADLDFRLYDDRDVTVASDTEPDDTPMITYTPRRTGTYRLRVTMAACSAGPCWWGLGIYR
jgi:hypothetical protein